MDGEKPALFLVPENSLENEKLKNIYATNVEKIFLLMKKIGSIVLEYVLVFLKKTNMFLLKREENKNFRILVKTWKNKVLSGKAIRLDIGLFIFGLKKDLVSQKFALNVKLRKKLDIIGQTLIIRIPEIKNLKKNGYVFALNAIKSLIKNFMLAPALRL